MRTLHNWLAPILDKLISLQFYPWAMWNWLRYGGIRPIRVDNRELYVRSSDKRGFLISRSNGRLQRNLMRIWDRLLALQADVYVDVGANYGVFSLRSVLNDQKTIVLEPHPRLYECLRLTFSEYDNCHLYNSAAYKESQEELEFYYNPNFSGTSSVSESVTTALTSSFMSLWPSKNNISDENRLYSFLESLWPLHRTRTQKTIIQAHSLDDLLKNDLSQSLTSVVLKVDVEGFEVEVFDGALELLDACEWWRGLFEFNPPVLEQRGENPEQVWERFRARSGFVIDERTASHNEIKDLSDYELADCPNSAVDVLLGAGQVR